MEGMQGAKPLAQNNLGLPLPAGKSALRARVGGMGAEKQANGRFSGDQPDKPPAGYRKPVMQRRTVSFCAAKL